MSDANPMTPTTEDQLEALGRQHANRLGVEPEFLKDEGCGPQWRWPWAVNGNYYYGNFTIGLWGSKEACYAALGGAIASCDAAALNTAVLACDAATGAGERVAELERELKDAKDDYDPAASYIRRDTRKITTLPNPLSDRVAELGKRLADMEQSQASTLRLLAEESAKVRALTAERSAGEDAYLNLSNAADNLTAELEVVKAERDLLKAENRRLSIFQTSDEATVAAMVKGAVRIGAAAGLDPETASLADTLAAVKKIVAERDALEKRVAELEARMDALFRAALWVYVVAKDTVHPLYPGVRLVKMSDLQVLSDAIDANKGKAHRPDAPKPNDPADTTTLNGAPQ